MNILIGIKERKIKLELIKNGKKLDFLDIVEEYSLSEKLLPEIDRLIQRNGLKSEEIKEIKVESDQNDNFTTTRIAAAVANAWNWGKSA
ncbi:MAG TPA: hypothetical protein P5232_01810 [Candidatus Moranbacteria bacterium]|nr:hypothetical protein [Candidatus Moranbacteria bacterium]